MFDVEEIMHESANWNIDSVIYRGDVLHTFLFMDALTRSGICYTITPEFPFERFIYPNIALCPTCGNPTIEKPVSESQKNIAYYCEECNDWVFRSMY